MQVMTNIRYITEVHSQIHTYVYRWFLDVHHRTYPLCKTPIYTKQNLYLSLYLYHSCLVYLASLLL